MKLIISVFVSVFLTALIAFFSVSSIYETRIEELSKVTSNEVTPNSNQELEELKQRVKDFLPGENRTVSSIIGTIESINSDHIIVSITPISPLDDSSLDQRTIKVTSEVLIQSSLKHIEISKETEDEEEDTVRNSNSETSDSSGGSGGSDEEDTTSNSQENKETLSLSDLTIGDRIDVRTDYNIHYEKEITLYSIGGY